MEARKEGEEEGERREGEEEEEEEEGKYWEKVNWMDSRKHMNKVCIILMILL